MKPAKDGPSETWSPGSIGNEAIMSERHRGAESGGQLDAFFRPRSIAVVGAQAEASKAGGRVLKILRDVGFQGVIIPVNPKQSEIGGLVCYPSVTEIPAAPDLAILCLPAAAIAAAIRQCGRAGIKAAVVLADGFNDPVLRKDLEAAFAEAHAASGLRIIGPNTLGFRANESRSYATFASDAEGGIVQGPVAMVAQSGGLGVYYGSALLRRRGLGCQYIIDVGNEFDVDAAECIDYVSADASVSCIAVILEGFHDGRLLADAIRRARSRGKSVVFMKVGRSDAASDQIATHTGALAGKADLFDSVMRDAGAHVATNESDFMDALVINGFGRVPKGRRLGIVTPSGGYGIMSIDAAEQFGMEIPEPAVAPTPEEEAELRFGGFGNPLDYSSTISAGPRAIETALNWMAAQPNIDAVLFWQSYILERPERQDRVFSALAEATARSKTPIFCCGVTTKEFEEKLRDELGILWFEEPTQLVRALSVVAPGAPFRHAKHASGGHGDAARKVIAGERARQVLGAVSGIRHVESRVVDTAEQALREQAHLGADKIVLKVESDAIAHKSELGLVSAPLAAHEVANAFEKLALARQNAGDPVGPIILQPFEKGVELALGAYTDPVFGPTVMVAAGGIFLEIFNDAAFAPAPISPEKARELILGLKAAPLLLGARGKSVADVDAAAHALSGLSTFIATHPEYSEIDLNPLIVGSAGHGAIAVDAVLIERD